MTNISENLCISFEGDKYEGIKRKLDTLQYDLDGDDDVLEYVQKCDSIIADVLCLITEAKTALFYRKCQMEWCLSEIENEDE